MARSKQGRKKKQQKKPQGGDHGSNQDKPEDAIGSSGQQADDYHSYTSYSPIQKKNEAFEKYYKEQGIVPSDEWDNFMSSLQDELPVTFRITGYRSHAQHMLSYLKGHYISELMDKVVDGVAFERPKPMPWYPDELAWQFSTSRKSIRKLAEYKQLHSFLVTETESGNISRQEAVSMIPPMLLDVKPQHKVLDMCAAPGSKTAQLIELVHAEQVYGWPEGFVVANDSDNKRCYIMVHQAKRLNSPCCMIVNHDATVFPTIRVPPVDGKRALPLKYDRILCDVPCSGDGTLRKNFLIWKKWSPNSALNLHVVQHRILQRGAELLEVGGRMVYSTCSFNPIENEAVIASVLQKCQGTLELLDVSDELPGLKRSPGLTSWKVMGDAGDVYASVEDIPEGKRQRYKPSHWPPSEEEAVRLNLNRCVRVLPHHQNTGGFFVAVLRKVAIMPWMKQTDPSEKTMQAMETANGGSNIPAKEPLKDSSEDPMEVEPDAPIKDETMDGEPTLEPTSEEKVSGDLESTDDTAEEAMNESLSETPGDSEPTEDQPADKDGATNSDNGPPPAKKKKGFQGYKEDPFVFFKDNEEIWPPIKEFFAVKDTFPVDQMLTRCHGGKKRNLYFVNRGIKSILETNEGNLKVINSGVKIWSRSDAKDVGCDFRLAQEGIYSVFPYLASKRQVANITKNDVRTLLAQENPFCYKLDPEAREATTALGPGSLMFVYDPRERDPDSNDMSLVLVGWRGKNSVRSYIAKGERQHILRMCDIDVSPDGMADASEDGDKEKIEDGDKGKCEDGDKGKCEDADTAGEGTLGGETGSGDCGEANPINSKESGPARQEKSAAADQEGSAEGKAIQPQQSSPAEAKESPLDSPRSDRRQDRDRSRKRDREGDRHRDSPRDRDRDRDRHGHRSSSRDDEAQRKRDFYFYYY